MISLIDFFYLEKIDVIVGWQFGFVSAVTFIQRAIARSSLRIQMCVYVCVCDCVCSTESKPVDSSTATFFKIGVW